MRKKKIGNSNTAVSEAMTLLSCSVLYDWSTEFMSSLPLQESVFHIQLLLKASSLWLLFCCELNSGSAQKRISFSLQRNSTCENQPTQASPELEVFRPTHSFCRREWFKTELSSEKMIWWPLWGQLGLGRLVGLGDLRRDRRHGTENSFYTSSDGNFPGPGRDNACAALWNPDLLGP